MTQACETLSRVGGADRAQDCSLRWSENGPEFKPPAAENQAIADRQSPSHVAHRIDLRPDLRPGGKRYGKTPMLYRGRYIGSSNSPIYAAARWLLDNGVARPDDLVVTYRGTMPCMSGKAGELAKWTVQEDDHGLRLVHWRPFPDAPYASKTAKLRATGTPLASAAFSGNSAKTLTSGTVAREGGAL